MRNKITLENEAAAAKFRQGKLQAAGLLISNAIHALEMIDDMAETKEQLYSVYSEIKEAEELDEDSSSWSAELNNGWQQSWSERITAGCPVVERWKNISA